MATLEELQGRIEKLDAVKKIEKLQRIYGYYWDYSEWDMIVDLFADDAESVEIADHGVYIGKEGVQRFYIDLMKGGPEGVTRPGWMSINMQLQGVITVADDGQSAKGRWYGFGASAFTSEGGGVNPGWMNGVYENEYIKEDGRWKIKKVHWCMTFHTPYAVGWVDPSRRLDDRIDRPYRRNPDLRPDGVPEETLYPSGFICPFHFDNPVSGREALT